MGLAQPRVLLGRKIVKCAISYDEFYKDPVGNAKKYITKCLSIHRENVKDFQYLKEQYLGKQDILLKTRTDDTPFNNINVENHLWKINNFKTGFTVGRPIEYSYKGDISTDDMDYLNRYLLDAGKASKDISLYMDKYQSGIAHRMIISRRTPSDSEFEAPFEIINLDNESTFVAHTNSVEKEVLFSCIINEKQNDYGYTNKYIYTIYLNDGSYFEIDSSRNHEVITPLTKQSINFNPIIECPLNIDRIGVLEIGLFIQNAINSMDSLELDDIEQFVSSYIVFENQEINDEFKKNLQELKKQRVLSIKSNNPQLPAKVYTLDQSLDHTNVNTLYDRLVTALYDITSTPKASGSVTSGGDTTGARLLGNGWESAQNQAEVDTAFMLENEMQQLKMIFKICRENGVKQIQNLYPTQIEIKYNINMSNNLLVKTQALSNLYSMNMPKEQALNMVDLTGDTHGVSTLWESKDKEAKDNENQNKQQESISDNIA